MSDTFATAPAKVLGAARLIKLYASRGDVGEDEGEGNTLYLFHAMEQSISPWEVCYIGCAMLARHEMRAVPGKQIGGKNCEPDLSAIHDALREIGIWKS